MSSPFIPISFCCFICFCSEEGNRWSNSGQFSNTSIVLFQNIDFAVDRDRSDIKRLAASGGYGTMSWPSDKSYNLCLYVGVGGLPCSKGLLFRFRCFSLSLFFSQRFLHPAAQTADWMREQPDSNRGRKANSKGEDSVSSSTSLWSSLGNTPSLLSSVRLL